ncbi:glycosyltransferase [Onishia niordana]|uniref:glycosyltransferase n=1 Tax=Onishia niordana TaxID=2508711 RepID=UPI001F10FDCB|nr:glycosyltransferase [Halomonas niordiana]
MSALDKDKPLAAIAIRQVEKSTGASRNAFEQAGALVELGYRVVILAERGKPALANSHGAELIRLWRWPLKGPFRRFWFNRCVQAWSRRHRPALLISHGDCETQDTVYLHNCVHLAEHYINGRELPAKHEVASIHDHVLNTGSFRQVAVNSRLMERDLMERYGIDPAKIEISYPGYDPEQFNLERARNGRTRKRDELGVSEDERLIGLVTSGNFAKRNVMGFIAMAADLDRTFPDRYRFMVVGKDDTTPYSSLAASVGIADRMIWRTTVPDVESLYGALDLFVLPAHIEEFGRVVIEAMACGTPTLVSERVGASELFSAEYPELVMEHSASSSEWSIRMGSLIDKPQRDYADELPHYIQQFSYVKQRKKLKSSLHQLAVRQS